MILQYLVLAGLLLLTVQARQFRWGGAELPGWIKDLVMWHRQSTVCY